MSTETIAYHESFAMYDDHPTGDCGFLCSVCQRPVDVEPCPEHAPTNIPGLTKVECDATPRHHWWYLSTDAYPPPCFQCQAFDLQDKLRPPMPTHWPWRRWKTTHRVVYILARLGIVASGAHWWGEGHEGCTTVRLRLWWR